MSRVRIYRTTNAAEIAQILERDVPIFGADTVEPEATTVWWAMRVEGVLAGYAGLLELPSNEGRTVFLNRSAVFKEWRGQGLQKRLIRVRLRYARERGYTHAITYTMRGNPASSNNLIGCGFRLYDPQWAYAGSVLYWQRAL
jgi:GNAT superfamily N-acetyltransferase